MKKPPDSLAKSGTKPRPPAFKNSELGPIPADWEVKRLEEIAPLQRGFDLPTSALAHGTIPVVYSNGILNFHETGLCNAPGLVTGRSGTIGKFTFIERGTYWPHNTTLWVTSFCGNEPKFVYYLYSRIGFERFSGGTGVPTLNRNDLHAYQIAIPTSVDEQRHIATALSDADAWIGSLDKLIEKKKLVKQGTMQALLSGKNRLPGFSGMGFKMSELGPIPVDWEVKQFGEVCADYAYGTGAEAIDYDGENAYIRITDIDEDSHLFSPSPRTSPASFSEKHVVKDNDLLVARTGASVGKTYFYSKRDGKLIFAGFLMKANVQHANGKYVFYWTLTEAYKSWVLSESARSGQPGLNIQQLKNMPIALPPHREQKAIAAVLSDMDAELASLSREKAKAEQIKQGMMQELLTGRVRLGGGDGICHREQHS